MEQPITLISADGAETETTLAWIDEDTSDTSCGVTIRFDDKEFSATGSDYFEALCAVRQQLEPAGLIPRCYGASRNCYPSGMGREMGAGMRAYRLVPGRQARQADLVSIFDDGPDIEPSTVAEQKVFFAQWVTSLRYWIDE